MVAKTRVLDALTSAERGRDASGCADGARSLQYAGVALLLIIALVAGITAGTIFGRPQAPAPFPGLAASSETARAFYDALNQALAGGGTEALAALLAPGFLDHDASIGEEQSAEDLLDRVRTLGQTPNVAPLIVDAIEVSGSSLIVHLARAETRPRVFAGISIEQTGNQPTFEVLRVARARIIDRWTPGIWWLEATELEDVAVRAPGLADIANTLVRIDVPPGMVHRWNSFGTGFLLIESGSARMHAIHFNGDEETHKLDRGAATSVTAGDRLQLQSVDGKPVTALVYLVKRRSAAETPPPAGARDAQSSGVTQSILWSGPFPHAEESSVHRPGTLVLPSGREIQFADTANTTVLVSIDSGSIEIAARGGVIAILEDDRGPVEHPNFAGIDVHRAASLSRASAITLRNVSGRPVTIVLVVIKIDEQAGPPIG